MGLRDLVRWNRYTCPPIVSYILFHFHTTPAPPNVYTFHTIFRTHQSPILFIHYKSCVQSNVWRKAFPSSPWFAYILPNSERKSMNIKGVTLTRWVHTADISRQFQKIKRHPVPPMLHTLAQKPLKCIEGGGCISELATVIFFSSNEPDPNSVDLGPVPLAEQMPDRTMPERECRYPKTIRHWYLASLMSCV